MACGACEDSILDCVERGAVRLWQADSNVIGTTLSDQGNGGRHAFDDCGGVGGELLRGKAEARRSGWIDLKAGGRSADRVFKSVEHIDYALLLLDRVCDPCGDVVENLGTRIEE